MYIILLVYLIFSRHDFGSHPRAETVAMDVLVPSVANPDEVAAAKKVKTLSRGGYFGEVALINNSVRTAWVLALSYLDLTSRDCGTIAQNTQHEKIRPASDTKQEIYR